MQITAFLQLSVFLAEESHHQPIMDSESSTGSCVCPSRCTKCVVLVFDFMFHALSLFALVLGGETISHFISATPEEHHRCVIATSVFMIGDAINAIIFAVLIVSVSRRGCVRNNVLDPCILVYSAIYVICALAMGVWVIPARAHCLGDLSDSAAWNKGLNVHFLLAACFATRFSMLCLYSDEPMHCSASFSRQFKGCCV